MYFSLLPVFFLFCLLIENFGLHHRDLAMCKWANEVTDAGRSRVGELHRSSVAQEGNHF